MNRIRQIFMVLMLMASLINYGCSAEEEGMNDDSQVEANSSNTVSFVMPDADEVSTYAEATSAERQIYGVVWLQFRGAIGTTAVAHGVMTTELATALMQNSTKYPMLTLPFKPEEGDRIVFLINVRHSPVYGAYPNPQMLDLEDEAWNSDYLYTSTPAVNFSDITENNIDEKFRLTAANWLYVTYSAYSYNASEHYDGHGEIPMYGKIDGWKSKGVNRCIITRAMASVQMSVANKPFKSWSYGHLINDCEWFIVNMPTYGSISANEDGSMNALESGNGTLDPNYYLWISSVNVRKYLRRRMVESSCVDSLKTFYMFEYPNSRLNTHGTLLDPKKFDASRQCVLLKCDGGYSWYRLDYYDQNTGKYIDIKRNTRYTFFINDISDSGYRTAEEALANPPSNISYAVKSTSTIGENVVVSNGQYALALDYNALLVYGDNSTAQTYSIGNVKFIDNSESPVESTITNNHIGANTASGATTNITSLNTNGSDNPLSITMPAGVSDATIGITVGGLYANIKVHREPELGGNEVAFMAHKTLHAEQIGSNPGIDGFSSVANPSASDLTTKFNANEISDCYVKLNANSSLSVRTSEVAMYGSPDYGGVSMKVILNQGTGIGEQPQLIVSPWELSQESIDAGSWIRSDETKYYVGIDQENKLHIDSEAKTISFTANSEVEIESITGGWLDEALVRSSFAAGLAADKKSGSFTAQYKDGTNFLDGSNNEIVSTVVLRAGTATLVLLIYPSEKPFTVPDIQFRAWLKNNIPYSLNELDQIIPAKARDYGEDMVLPPYNNIMDFSGIQYYTNLSSLYICRSYASSIDLSKNTKLQDIFMDNGSNGGNPCDFTLPTSNSNLKRVSIYDVSNSSMDFSGYANLKLLTIGSGINLTNIDIHNCTLLDTLSIGQYCVGPHPSYTYYSSQKIINVSSTSSLPLFTNIINGSTLFSDIKYFSLRNTQLTNIDMTLFPNVEQVLLASNSQLTTVDFSALNSLKYLDVNNSTLLTNLDLTSCSQLKTLNVSNIGVAILDVTPASNITSINVSSNSLLTDISASSLTYLSSVIVSSNPLLTTCDLSSDGNIQTLTFHSNPLLIETISGSGTIVLPTSVVQLTLLNNAGITSISNWSSMSNVQILKCTCTWTSNLDMTGFTSLKNMSLVDDLTSSNLMIMGAYQLCPKSYGSDGLTSITFGNNPQLELLRISSCPDLTSVTFNPSMTSLRVLNLGEYCPMLTSVTISSYLTNLQELNISCSAFQTVGSTGLNIEDNTNIVVINGTGNLSATSYYSILEGNITLPVMPKLKTLILNGNKIQKLDMRNVGTTIGGKRTMCFVCLGGQKTGNLDLLISPDFDNTVGYEYGSGYYERGWEPLSRTSYNRPITTYVGNNTTPSYYRE